MRLIAGRFTFDGLNCFIAGQGAPLWSEALYRGLSR